MANLSLMEQLNEAVEAIIAHPDAPLPKESERLTEVLRVAAELRDLPNQDFRDRLKADLEKRAAESKAATTMIPEGYHTVTPYLTARKADQLISFVKEAFGAEELFRTTGSAGGIHSEVRIGDSMMMIGGGEMLGETLHKSALHLYVPDADAVYQDALKAGAESIYQPMDQPYGDREAGVKDAAGNYWFIASSLTSEQIPEGLHSVTPYLLARGAPGVIDFLSRAFGAEEQFRAQSADGIIHHAKMKIGDTVVELGEAFGEWQPTLASFYLYVDDVDVWYQRTLSGGATTISEPTDQSYGDRVAGVKDPFGNEWYMATPLKNVSP